MPSQSPAPDYLEKYGTAQDGQLRTLPLYWDVYLPSSTPPPSGWPVVILVKNAGFEKGRRCAFPLPCMARDLNASGFAVVSIDVRHDKVGTNTGDYLPCQAVPALAPQTQYRQVDDLKAAILAARSPNAGSILHQKVNHKVGAVGGSGGGTLVAWCATTETTSGDKLDAAVCLSGAYKLDDKPSLRDTGYCLNVTDYCAVAIPPNGCGRLEGNPDLVAASPITEMAPGVTNPILAFATFQDYMPRGQFNAICTEFEDEFVEHCSDAANTDYRAIEFNQVNGNTHSFAYWFDPADTAGNEQVNDIAKAFLCAQLGASCSP